MGWLLSVYIGAAVFGVGITLVDLFGLIGSHEGTDHDAGGHEGVDHDIGAHDGGSDHDVGDHGGGADHDVAAHEGGISHAGMVDYDSAAHGTGEGTGRAGEDASAGHAAGDDSTAEPGAPGDHHGDSGRADRDGSLAGHDRPERRSLLLGLLATLRNLIYFCLGFGPVGWFALTTSGSVVTSLLWSVPVGGAALLGTRALRRLMRRELNSAVSTSEILMERGVVTVSIARGELGKVRIKLGDLYVERFARAASAQTAIRVGASVRVTDVSDDCVYVEEE